MGGRQEKGVCMGGKAGGVCAHGKAGRRMYMRRQEEVRYIW